VAFSSAAAEPVPLELGRWDGRQVRLVHRVQRQDHPVLRPERPVGEVQARRVTGPDCIRVPVRALDLAEHKPDQGAARRGPEVPAQHKLDRDDKPDGDAAAVAAHTQK